ncbi:proteoglycan 3-like [Echinops telfairi]|uniref:Proteoglycan 3-like n=1 Tax=Echinops telfairi TaxID=9371 RepID=A0ABM0J549_ECHTE|nr:proteoglycan 3-like [Echinops telfairi]
MNCPPILLLLLLGTVSALHLRKDAPKLEMPETVTDPSQNLECSGEPEGELALAEKEIPSEGAASEAAECKECPEKEEPLDLESAPVDKDLQCPREEETVRVLGTPGCKTCGFRLVLAQQTFVNAQAVCQRCYGGSLVSIHNFHTNSQILCTVSRLNVCQVWIGGFLRCLNFQWTDGTCWNYAYWAPGQPRCGCGNCVAMNTRGGGWRRTPCVQPLPFICSR